LLKFWLIRSSSGKLWPEFHSKSISGSCYVRTGSYSSTGARMVKNILFLVVRFGIFFGKIQFLVCIPVVP
jgi:hypothetical protein